MATNRLKLNFSLVTAKERNEFVTSYLENNKMFQDNPLTAAEIEAISNYLLWGKDEDGKNSVQRKEIHIATKNKTWNRLQEEESLDALIEQPTFNESVIMRPGEAKLKTIKETFSRERALKECPPELVPEFERLFKEIDEVDLVLNYYDLEHGKRKKQPREELLSQFTEEEQNKLRLRALGLNQYNYLKMRHLLVELRRQQFAIKDGYSSNLQRDLSCRGHTDNAPADTPSFGTEINVYPLGMINEQTIGKLIFKPFNELIPQNFDAHDLEIISKHLWKERDKEKYYFDFTNLEHVYNLFLMYFDIEESVIEDGVDKSANCLLNTLFYYMDRAELTEIQKEILNLKVNGFKNQEIAEKVNAKFGSSYSSNYISTIFRQKIIKQINEAAKYHRHILENIFFPEEFKKCICCGEVLLRDPKNFVRKSRAKDGFVNKCKRCDKRDREIKKEANNG